MEVLDTPHIQRRLLTVEQYHRMAEIGVLAPDEHIELIEGEVIQMAPVGTRHFAVLNRINRLLTMAVGERAIVSVQMPLQLGALSEPEPDLCVLNARDDFYASSLPTAADALLVIEVADRSLAYDLRFKAELYARHGVTVYWVLDLQTPALHVLAEPRGGAYARSTQITSPGLMPIPGLADLTVDLSGVLQPHR